jgi:hypothetical protein
LLEEGVAGYTATFNQFNLNGEPMKKKLLLLGLMVVTASAQAKDQIIPLSEADAKELAGKTIALTTHERPSFVAMTAGKAGLIGGLLGGLTMIAAGNELVAKNNIQDPAEIVRTQLADALTNAYSPQVLPLDTNATKATKPKEIAALHPEADYVLDVRSGAWSYLYYPTHWGKYKVGYNVQVQLIDTKTAKQVSNMACNAGSSNNPDMSPTRDQLHADGAKLLKDILASAGWTCVQLLAKEQFKLAPDQVAATPAELVDPLAALL